MRSWQKNLAIADAQMRAAYYRRLIEVAKLNPALARIHTENASIEDMKNYLSFDKELVADNRRLTFAI